MLLKRRSYAEVYNDMDGELVNLFRVIRDNGEALAQACELTPFARVEFAHSYEPAGDPLEQARRTLVRSFMGFGSAGASGQVTGFRSNSNRSGTTPAHDWMHYPESLRAIVQRLRGVVIENRNATDVMRHHDGPKTLFYVDPPYVHATRNLRSRAAAYRHELSDQQHIELAAALRALSGMVVLSGYPCELYERLYAGWRRIERLAHADGARPRTEVLWMNPACSAALEKGQAVLFEDAA
jgi:DNA adenine methylase